MRLAVAQMSIAADLEASVGKHLSFIRRAADDGVHLLCFPEMSLTGYHRHLLDDARLADTVDAAVERLHRECMETGVGAIVGYGYPDGERLANRAGILLPDGCRSHYDKMRLVSQEEGIFRPGTAVESFSLGAHRIGVIICRDQNDPALAASLAADGADVLFITSAHYYRAHEARWKADKNRALPIARAVENGMWTLLATTVGAHVGYVSLGGALIADPHGCLVVAAGECEETLFAVDISDP